MIFILCLLIVFRCLISLVIQFEWFKPEMEKNTIQKLPFDLRFERIEWHEINDKNGVGLWNADQKIGQKCETSICLIISTIINGCYLLIGNQNFTNDVSLENHILLPYPLLHVYGLPMSISIQQNKIYNIKLLFSSNGNKMLMLNWKLGMLTADCWLLTFINLYIYLIIKKMCSHFNILRLSKFIQPETIRVTENVVSKFFFTLQPLAWDVLTVFVCFHSQFGVRSSWCFSFNGNFMCSKFKYIKIKEIQF